MHENEEKPAGQKRREPEAGVYPVAGDELSSEIDVVEVLGVLQKTRRELLAFSLFFLAIGVVVAFALPVRYTSTASFIPPSNSATSSAASVAGQLSALGGGNLFGGGKSSGDLYAGILKSRSVADRLVQRFNLRLVYGVQHDSDAVKALASRTTVEVGIKDSIVALTVADASPERARDLANAYLDALRVINGRLALTESSQRRLFYEQQLAQEKTALEDAEVDLKKTEEQSGMIAPIGQTTLQIETIAQTRALIAARQVELAALRQSSTEQNPRVIRLESEIADLNGQLARLQNGGDTKDAGTFATSKVPALQLEYVRREREVRYHETLFGMISKQYETARMDESREAPILQVLDPASYPEAKSFPPRALIVLGSLVLGLVIGILKVLGAQYLQPTKTIFMRGRGPSDPAVLP